MLSSVRAASRLLTMYYGSEPALVPDLFPVLSHWDLPSRHPFGLLSSFGCAETSLVGSHGSGGIAATGAA
jgi:hypothetical protein